MDYRESPNWLSGYATPEARINETALGAYLGPSPSISDKIIYDQLETHFESDDEYLSPEQVAERQSYPSPTSTSAEQSDARGREAYLHHQPQSISIAPPRPPEVHIIMVNARADLTMPIDPHHLALTVDNSEHHWTEPNLCKISVRTPRARAIVRGTGIICISGPGFEKGCRQAMRIVWNRIRTQAGYVKIPRSLVGYRQYNVMARAKLGFRVRLVELCRVVGKPQAEYEPELQAFLCWRVPAPKVSINVYGTGSLSFLGATSEKAVRLALEIVWPRLWACRWDRGGSLNKTGEVKEVGDRQTLKEFEMGGL